VSPDLVLEMVSLVVNEYPTRVKTKKTISMYTMTIEEVVDVEEHQENIISLEPLILLEKCSLETSSKF
jgi:hypothetical protein